MKDDVEAGNESGLRATSMQELVQACFPTVTVVTGAARLPP